MHVPEMESQRDLRGQGNPRIQGDPRAMGNPPAQSDPRTPVDLRGAFTRPGNPEPSAAWKLEGVSIHDRMLELIRRYMDSAMQQATGMQGMMMRNAAGQMYPRIERTIQGMSEDKLKQEIATIQAELRQVLGQREAAAKAKKRAQRGAGKAGKRLGGTVRASARGRQSAR